MNCTGRYCNNRPQPGRRCDECRARHRRYAATARASRRKIKRCPQDSRPLAPGKQVCQICLERSRKYSAKRRERAAANLECWACHGPVELNPRTGKPYQRCAECRKRFNEIYHQDAAA
jgi:hypothetical protein